ncbi:hypothetical protein Drose_27410 [Dactylosporangium roseum]|uniref:Lipoprotein n=1 Tax=Dactylosporangium roseum TaxID=47989 RepID=A0ABY5YYR3_9ACTN|nr:hypothetical protein [Dactylosporangium roseum]UWZ34886.1 hypothetical protein Drose_27410 [Dactylosporangium roseum]
MPSARQAGAAAVSLAVLAVLAVLAGCGRDPAASTPQAAASPAASSPAAPSLSPAPAGGSSAPATSAAPITVPAGVTAGIVIYDRHTATFVAQQNASWRFRSASLVKLLIALDYFWDKGPGYTVPAADRPKLDVMLRSSDDAAATALWKAHGSRDVVIRMVRRLDLRDTAPPPVSQPGYWGYTAVSAGDLVRVYRYILEQAPAPVRDYIMGNLHASTKCGTDRYDQSFGIPSAFRRPWSAKQGWSGFGDVPATPCVADAALDGGDGAVFVPAAAPNDPDMDGEVLHTTGTVGESDRYVVAVLTVHPDRTPFAKAAAALTGLTRSLPLPPVTKS